jgi:flavin reductase (DIM6/NTAB) family NADH-FMN oxidoreductase RutF
MPTEEEAMDRMDEAVFREVVGHFTTGVAVITTRRGAERFGVTASAVSSLSMEPPMLLVCLNRRLPTRDALLHTRRFAVNILAEHQRELALQFATRQADKFAGASVHDGADGVPLLGDALAYLECSVTEHVDAATHTVFLAAVRSATARTGAPLTYFRGGFGRFAPAVAA